MDEAAGEEPGGVVGEVEEEGPVEVSIRTAEALATLRLEIWLRQFPPLVRAMVVAEGPVLTVVLKTTLKTNVLLPKRTSCVHI